MSRAEVLCLRGERVNSVCRSIVNNSFYVDILLRRKGFHRFYVGMIRMAKLRSYRKAVPGAINQGGILQKAWLLLLLFQFFAVIFVAPKEKTLWNPAKAGNRCFTVLNGILPFLCIVCQSSFYIGNRLLCRNLLPVDLGRDFRMCFLRSADMLP